MLDNLKYVTYSQNAQHAHDTGLHRGSKIRAIIDTIHQAWKSQYIVV